MTLRANDEIYSSDDKSQVYFDVAPISAATAIVKHLTKAVETNSVPWDWLKLEHELLPYWANLVSLRCQGFIIHVQMAIHRVPPISERKWDS